MPSCPICKRHASQIFDIRGRRACLHCQLDFIWDFMEGTRRLAEELNEFMKSNLRISEKEKKKPVLNLSKHDSRY